MFHHLAHFKVILLPVLFAGMLAIIASCTDNGVTPVVLNDIGPFDTTGVPHYKAENGFTIYFHEQGYGNTDISENDVIRLRYTGRTLDGDIFDSSKRDGVDSPISLNVGGLVPGFKYGLAGVVIDGNRKHAARIGSIRTLVIPPEYGYSGTSNSLNEDTLIFDIEILGFSQEN
ncbi:MAG: FKBP-type peptidyl-prolyl cis-trans isomerase [Balneolales bacterium]